MIGSSDRRGLANLFGEQFAAALVDFEPGSWQGPIESAYGAHVAIVDQLQAGRVPDLDDVRVAVRRELEHARRQQLTDKYYQELLNKYDVVIEPYGLDAEAE